jgi:internalin A
MSPEERRDRRRALRLIRRAKETGATSLDLSYLALSALPRELASLVALQSLSLAECKQISNLAPLAGLTALRSLNLSTCEQISDLTPLAGLIALQSLDLFMCKQISDLTPLASMTALRFLSLVFCGQISDLTPLASLAALRSLNLAWCRGARLFAALEVLLPTLKWVNLLDCVFEDLPAEVCGDNVDENVLAKVRAHYADVRAGQVQDAELKVFVLGNGGAGKTQLCRRLRGLSYDPSVSTTHGIQLSEMTLELKDFATPIRLNLWDFGGQEVYHGSHALFLQGRAVFLVLWTPELEAQTSYQENGLSMRHRPVPYWLDYLRAFSGVDSPLVLTQSQCDTPAHRVRRPLVDGTDDFAAIQSIQFSAKTSLGFDSLKAALKEAVRDSFGHRPPPPIGTGRVRVRNRLRKMPDRLLERAAFDRICEEEGGISDTEALLDFLHHCGVIFYKAGLFGGRIVLDQNWALEAIYAVFDRKKILPLLRGYGRFSRADLEALVWSSYTREEQELFLDMMVSCGICFRAGLDYIAPELLPAKSEAQETLLAGRLLKDPPGAAVKVRYAFLHEGVLRNFLSKIGTQAGEAAIYWKYGCWFYEKTTDSRVVIEGMWQGAGQESGEGSIVFRAWGARASKLIEPLLAELQRLPLGQPPSVAWAYFGTEKGSAARLENLEPAQALQPASGTPDVYVSYAWGQNEKVVDDMCNVIEAEGWRVIRDKTAMKHGDRISDFMKCLSRGDLIVVVLSAKYLQSNYCMTELHGVYQRALGDKGEFLDRIIPVSLDDTKISSWRDRTETAKHWEDEFQEMEKCLPLLGQQDFGLYKSMQDWHNRVGDILAYANDVLRPHGLESIVKDGFATLCQMLQAKRAR